MHVNLNKHHEMSPHTQLHRIRSRGGVQGARTPLLAPDGLLLSETRGLEAFTRMIFFKFSGISLVSVGRERPGNEI